MNKKIGYYVCDGIDYSSKVQGALDAAKKQKPLEWVFNNDVFSKFDFSTEPEETIDELYDARARQLREEYDYLILSYSGGADSHNILMAFHRQGLHIDEIVTNWVFDAAKSLFLVNDPTIKDPWNHNAEFELNAKEKLNWISANMPRTTITVWDISKNLISYYVGRAKDNSWVLDAKDSLNPAANQRYNYFHIKDLRTRVDKKVSVGIICGVDKPPCVIKDGKLYLQFLDKIANNVPMNSSFKEYDNCTLEFFYWSPDSCKILAKQCHALLKHLSLNQPHRNFWTETPYFFMFRDARERILRNIVYTIWDDAWYQANKSTRDWDSEFDYWFLHNPQLGKAKYNWEQGLTNLKNEIGDEYLSLDGRGLLKIHSPLYYVGELPN